MNWERKIFNADRWRQLLFALLYFKTRTKKLKQKLFEQKKLWRRTMLPARVTFDFNVARAGNIAYWWMTRDAIWTNRVRVFYVEV